MDKDIERNTHIIKLLDNIGFKNINRIKPLPHSIWWKSLSNTHKHIIELISKFNKEEYYCIFEDDIELADNFPNNKVKEYINEYINKIGYLEIPFICLGVCLGGGDQVKNCTMQRCNALCAHAYMVTPTGAKWLLDNIALPSKDWSLDWPDNNYSKVISPPIIGHEYSHNHTHPDWKGLFYQARKASWYYPSKLSHPEIQS